MCYAADFIIVEAEQKMPTRISAAKQVRGGASWWGPSLSWSPDRPAFKAAFREDLQRT
jgi:hypothetical protein